MSADTALRTSPTLGQDQRPAAEPSPAANPAAQPRQPLPDETNRPATPLDARGLGPVIDAITNFGDLARPWYLALLIPLAGGPTATAAVSVVAESWAEGHLPYVHMPTALAELVEAGLAVHPGGRGDAALSAMTSAGERLLDRFDRATSQLNRWHPLVGFADSCALHDRLLRLSATESRVLGLVVCGRTDQQIAAMLFLSRRTVEVHVERILRTLGLRSRNALIARLTIESVEL